MESCFNTSYFGFTLKKYVRKTSDKHAGCFFSSAVPRTYTALALKPLRCADRKRTCELPVWNQTGVPARVNLQRARLRTALNEQKTLLVKDFSGFFVRSTVSSFYVLAVLAWV
jgi:hypothetical protein